MPARPVPDPADALLKYAKPLACARLAKSVRDFLDSCIKTFAQS
jgi:hypothetical protein